jgi:hypothetical protein
MRTKLNSENKSPTPTLETLMRRYQPLTINFIKDIKVKEFLIKYFFLKFFRTIRGRKLKLIN